MMLNGQNPWSSGYGRRLMFLISRVWIPAQYTGLNLFQKYGRKRGQEWPIFKKVGSTDVDWLVHNVFVDDCVVGDN